MLSYRRRYFWWMPDTEVAAPAERPLTIACEKCGQVTGVKPKGPVPTMCPSCRVGAPRRTRDQVNDVVSYLSIELEDARAQLVLVCEERDELLFLSRDLQARLDARVAELERLSNQVEVLTKIATSIDGIER